MSRHHRSGRKGRQLELVSGEKGAVVGEPVLSSEVLVLDLLGTSTRITVLCVAHPQREKLSMCGCTCNEEAA